MTDALVSDSSEPIFLMIVYNRRPKPKGNREAAQPAMITGSVVVRARRPKKYQSRLIPLTDDPEADERVRRFFDRMGLGAVYQRAVGLPD